MSKIASASRKRKLFRIRFMFRQPLYGSIRSGTFSNGSLPNLPISMKVAVLGIHLSFQIEIDEPSPTRLMTPTSKAARPAIMAFPRSGGTFGSSSLHKICMWEVFPFQNPSTKRAWVREKASAMFSKHCKIKLFKVPETHASNIFRCSQFLPRDPVKRSLVQ